MKIRLAPLLFIAATALALTVPVAHAQLAKPFLWELTKSDKPGDKAGDKTVTLFGSLHVGKPDFYPLSAPIQSRFDTAGVLAVEADVTLPETRTACEKLATTSDKLETLLGVDDFAALSSYIRASGVNPAITDGRKLWMVNLVLVAIELSQLGVDFSRGIDVTLIQQALQQKKKIAEVEGGARQCAALAGASNAESVASMSRFLATVRENRMESRLADMLDNYRTGNGPALAKLIADEFGDSADGTRARRRIFDERHPQMAEMIDSYFSKQESHFVVVGVGHMLGTNNLLEALEKRGIKARRIQ